MQKLILGSIFVVTSSGASVAGTVTITEIAAWAGPDTALLASCALVAAGLIAAALDRIHLDRNR